jgi:branched-chain amino acid transport system substrate-binding protein
VNAKVQHDMWFNNSPWNDASSWSDGFIRAGQKAGAKSIAVLAADQEFAQNLANGARTLAKKANLKTVYDQNYPPTTTDFSSLIRAIRAAKPDMVFFMSYPNDSVAIVRAVNEIGVGSQVQIIGGGMVGLQFTPIMASLGSLMNGFTNYNSYVPGMKYPGIEDFLKRYAARAKEAKVDPLGFYLPPFNYAIGQMLEQAPTAWRTRSSPSTCAKPSSAPSSARSASTRTANGPTRAWCRRSSAAWWTRTWSSSASRASRW